MFGRNLEDLIKKTSETRTFDEDFFDFTDKLYPWTTVYRFFFLTDLEKKTQLMLGVGQKTVPDYWINGKKIEFSNEEPNYRVGISYWIDNGTTYHETRNEHLRVKDGMSTDTFLFTRNKENDYIFVLDDLSTNITLDEKGSRTDYIKFKAGLSPFYRHNKYMNCSGEILGENVAKGCAFIQKVNLNMPFVPWRWGRAFFEDQAQLDFYEPRFILPLYKSINFETKDVKIQFKSDQKIAFNDPVWTISGKAISGEEIKAKINSYNKIKHTFETQRSTFEYLEMPSKIEEFTIKKNGKTLYSSETMGESVANCEVSRYSRISLRQQ